MSRTTVSVSTVQKSLAVRHHETGGRVHHPGNPDGVYGRFTAAALSSWFRNDSQGQAQRDTGIVMVTDPDGRVRHISITAAAATMMAANEMGYSTGTHRWPIAPTTTTLPGAPPPPAEPALPPVPPAPAGAPQPWYGEGSMELDPETSAPLPPFVPGAEAVPTIPPAPEGAVLPTLRRREEAPLWPWIAGGVAIAAVVGVVVWKTR